jgi:hypothetical protein
MQQKAWLPRTRRPVHARGKDPLHLRSDGADELGAVRLFDFHSPFDIGGKKARGDGVAANNTMMVGVVPARNTRRTDLGGMLTGKGCMDDFVK